VKDGRRKKEAEVGLQHATGTADRQGSASEVGKATLDIGLDGCMCEDCILCWVWVRVRRCGVVLREASTFLVFTECINQPATSM
jgi:hypothetical protein